MKKSLGRILSVLIMLVAAGMTVRAADADDIKINRVLQVNSDVELYEQPDASSAVVTTLPGGTPVVVKEDAQGDWCKVAYKEQTGYVQTAFLGLIGSPSTSALADGAVSGQEAQPGGGIAAAIDVDALNEEFNRVQKENQQLFQEAETTAEHAVSGRMWGIVIAVLVIAIFAVGIVTTLVGNKGKKKER